MAISAETQNALKRIKQEYAAIRAKAKERENDISGDALTTIPKNAILDSFPMDDSLVYALNDNVLSNTNENLILFMKATVDAKGNVVLVSLAEDEYSKAIEEYKKFLDLFGGNE